MEYFYYITKFTFPHSVSYPLLCLQSPVCLSGISVNSGFSPGLRNILETKQCEDRDSYVFTS